jgi:hypothetical protein
MNANLHEVLDELVHVRAAFQGLADEYAEQDRYVLIDDLGRVARRFNQMRTKFGLQQFSPNLESVVIVDGSRVSALLAYAPRHFSFPMRAVLIRDEAAERARIAQGTIDAIRQHLSA